MIKPGIYRHYKGPHYEVLDICVHSETEEKMVYYKPVTKDQTFVRPYEMFSEQVLIDGKLVSRFQRVEDSGL